MVTSKVNDVLRNLYKQKKLEPYIRYIRFPYYKNLVPNTKIDFTFPITAIIGKNGSCKSSIIKALYGSPEGYSVGNYWFSTAIDPIEETGESTRNRLIYGYYYSGANKIVEVIKTRIKNNDDPDYWEPARPASTDGMDKFTEEDAKISTSKTRWPAIKKKVVLLDFRHTISAFDRYYYHWIDDDYKKRRKSIRTSSKKLSEVIEKDLKKFQYHRKNRILLNITLEQNQINVINQILGKNYTEVKLVKHSFFGNIEGYTVKIFCKQQYTEAFAGSGEFAIIMLVWELTKDNVNNCLILLDEPETSLHPSAQINLMSWLCEEVKNQKHQIVIATHSPNIICSLPPDAIKVIRETPDGKMAIDSQSSTPEEAFFEIGQNFTKKTIFVEDELSKAIIVQSLKDCNQDYAVDIKVHPGGAQTIINFCVNFIACKNSNNIFVLLDGDLNQGDWPDPNTLADNDIKEIIKKLVGFMPKFPINGGNDSNHKIEKIIKQKEFLQWGQNHIKYLPNKTPEALLLEWAKEDTDVQTIRKDTLSNDTKKIFAEITKLKTGEHADAKSILTIQRILIRNYIKIDDRFREEAIEIQNIVKDFLKVEQ